jgi:hypothetical protein
MDLTRGASGIATILAALAMGACSSEDYSIGDDGVVLPASLLEAYPIAQATARAWSNDVFVLSAGGGFAVMNEAGLARDHSYQFHSRRRLQTLTVHLIGGIPWTQEISDPVPPGPPIFVDFVPYVELLDSDDVVPQAVEEAIRINAAFPDSIPAATHYAARLLSIAVWPEAESVNDPTPNTQAWRVDFLVLQPFGGSTTYFSNARYYIHPRNGLFLGAPVVPSQPELYPFPQGFPP